MAPPQAKRKREAATKDWRWLLWDSAFATEYLHQKLGAGWTTVLKEACCVRADKEKEKVERLREDGGRGPLRLWPKAMKCCTEMMHVMIEKHDFKGMVPTVPLLEWCVRRKYKPNAATFEATARGGDMDAIRWLREHKCPWEEEGKSEYYGLLDTDMHVEYNACDGAAEGGHLDVLKWLRMEGCPWHEGTCSRAARGGHLDVLKYAHENGCPWDVWTCQAAAQGGHLAALKYAHENGCPWELNTCRIAALYGHLAVLKYAHEKGCPWNGTACYSAARKGHLHVLKYLHENGCPWDTDTCDVAACLGHLDVLKYARKNGCPWYKDDCLRSAKTEEIKAWIQSQP